MKPQRLTVLDIYVLAQELDKKYSGSFIDTAARATNNVDFFLANKALRFTIISGNPYLAEVEKAATGKNWLQPIHGCRITGISQKQADRILQCNLAIHDSLGKRREYRLYLEFFKNGNVILTDRDDIIIAGFRRSAGKGEKYSPAEPAGFNILNCPADHIPKPAELETIKSLKLLQHFDFHDKNPAEIVEHIMKAKANPEPCVLQNDDSKIIGYAFYGPPYEGLLTGIKTKTFLEAVTLYVSEVSSPAIRSEIDHAKKIKKIRKKIDSLESELNEARRFNIFRQFGELILANIKNIEKIENSYIVPNIYAEKTEKIKIEINPALAPEQNARAFFDKARKLEASIPLLKKRLAELRNEAADLQKPAVEQLSDTAVEKRPATEKKTRREKLPFRRFDLGKGWQVYVGKSALTNDQLTFSFAAKDDFWFHAWQAAGSHLVLKRPHKGAIPDKSILIKAASIAAHYSKAKHSGKVPVIYTEIRYVRKIKRAPGKVSVANEKQLMVEPAKPETYNG
jgi:predicted ribosome quality control (RQC) complex YloA/Tae2 family protein